MTTNAETLLITALEADAAIRTHVGITPNARIYPLVMPQKPTLPCITFQRISNARVNSFDAGGGIDNPVLQIDSWATTRASARLIAMEIKRVIEASTTMHAWLTNDAEFFEDDVDPQLYRVSQDFSCWLQES